jgi:hypothetical protein
MPAPSWELVVDASILRAAGSEGATHPHAANARQVLTAILTICHKVVMSSSIKEEWDTHQSKFARRWRVEMHARRKVLNRLSRDCEHLKEAVGVRTNEYQKDAAAKDFLRIEAALNGDGIILSWDNRSRDIFRRMSKELRDISGLFWIDPIGEIDEVVTVLQGLAPLRQTWRLDPTRAA